MLDGDWPCDKSEFKQIVKIQRFFKGSSLGNRKISLQLKLGQIFKVLANGTAYMESSHFKHFMEVTSHVFILNSTLYIFFAFPEVVQ